ncbi:hypothetical protein HC928_01295 [bacterium]|nr:hypothetical protein [bacterium]
MCTATPFKDLIVTTVRQMTRAGHYARVYPHHVTAHLPVRISERHLRRHMAALAQEGKIIRLSYKGGYKAA